MRASKKICLELAMVIIVGLLLLSFSSCSKDDASTISRVMMLGNPDGDIFDSSVKSIDVVENNYQDENAERTKSIVLENGDYEDVIYVQSKKSELTDTAIYSSENKNIFCYYNTASDKLTQIYAKNNVIAVPDSLVSESDYCNWVDNLLIKYGVDDLSAYRYSCQTTVVVSNEESTYQNQYSYFYSDVKPNERISERDFTYVRYLDEYPTTDKVTISIFEITGSVIIKFDEQNFTDFNEVTFDEIKITATVNSYISDSINTKKYKFVSMNIKNETLTYINAEVCMRVEVELELLSKSERTPLHIMVMLLVYSE